MFKNSYQKLIRYGVIAMYIRVTLIRNLNVWNILDHLRTLEIYIISQLEISYKILLEIFEESQGLSV